MVALIIIAIVVIGIFIIIASSNKKMNNKILECPLTYKSHGPRTHKMFTTALVGAFYRGINVKHQCDAYIVLEPCAEDIEAIAVYSANNIHLGYLPKDSKFKKRMVEYLKEVNRVDGYANLDMNPDNPFEPYNEFKTRLPKDFMD